MNADLMLRVVWPILDDGMYDAEAVADASMQWPEFAEAFQVTVLDAPRIRVVVLDEQQRRRLRAGRAVVCEAPVIVRRRRLDHTPEFVEERRHSAVRLTREGLSSNQIAVRLGVNPRTVYRYRKQYRLAS